MFNKKIYIFVAVLLLGILAAAGAQNVYYMNTPTLVFNDPNIGDDNFLWEVYAYDYLVGVTDDQDVAQLNYLGFTLTNEFVLSFPYSAPWTVGVRTKFTDDNGNVAYSAIAWSDHAEDADLVSGPFVYIPIYSPTKPSGLRDSGT